MARQLAVVLRQRWRRCAVRLIMFCVALCEVHMSNFGGPPLYLDIQQHREALLGDVAATTLAALYGLLCMKGSWSREFRMVGLTSALGVPCGFI